MQATQINAISSENCKCLVILSLNKIFIGDKNFDDHCNDASNCCFVK